MGNTCRISKTQVPLQVDISPSGTQFTGTVSQKFSQDFTAYNADGIIFSNDLTSSWLNIDISCPNITVFGMPPSPGTYNFIITATSKANNSIGDRQNYTIMIS